MTAGPTELPSLPSALFVWRSGRGGLHRLVAHVLIRLLILLPLPPQLQMGALLFPVSLLWPLVTARPAEAVKEGPAETAAEALLARSFPLSDGLSGVSPRRWDPVLALRTDIVMSGSTAIIAIGGGKAKLVDLTNPADPRITGELTSGVGTRLALTASNLLVSTYRTYLGNMNNPLQGLHVAAFDVIGSIIKPRPSFTRPVLQARGPNSTRAPAPPTEEETLKDLPIRVKVYPAATEVVSATLQLDNDGVNVGPPIPLTVEGGSAVYTLAKGFKRLIDATTSAVFEFFTRDGKRVKTPPKRIPTGQLEVRVDSNNDTKMGPPRSPDDDRDRQAAGEGKAFEFWQADRVRKDDDSLIDLARVSLHRQVEVERETRIALRIQGGTWEAYRRVDDEDLRGRILNDCFEPEGKLHLCNKDGVKLQLDVLKSTDPKEVITGPGDTKEIPHDLLVLRPKTTEILFRCLTGCKAPEKIEVGEILETGVFSPLSEAKIKFEDFRQMSSMLTLRQAGPGARTWTDDHYKVASVAQDEPNWTPLASKTGTAKQVTLIVHGYAVSHEEFTRSEQIWKDPDTPSEFETIAKRLYWAGHPILEGQDNARVVGVSWPGDIPGDINPIFQTALGTDNTRPYFQEDEFNAFLSGIPLADKLAELRNGPEGRKINVLAHSLGNLVVNSALQRLGGGGKPINYVMLQAAVTSEAFMQNYNPLQFQNAAGVKDLIDHAKDLGFPNPNEGRPIADWNWLNQENEVFQKLNEYPAPYACPREEPYQAYTNPDCGEPDVRPRPPVWQCDAARCHNATVFQRGWTALDKSLTPTPVATNLDSPPTELSYFNTRWGKMSRNPDGSLRGAWSRLYFGNVDPLVPPPGIRVFNAYNPGDHVLRIDKSYHERLPYLLDFIRYGLLGLFSAELNSQNIHAWKALQILSKPFSPPGPEPALNRLRDIFWQGGAGDELVQQKWWTLEIEGRPSAWQTTTEVPAWVVTLTGGDLEWIRRRGELAMWFPALAAPAGVVPLEALSRPIVGDLDLPAQGSNVDMSGIGGADGPNANGTPSHSYAVMKKYQEVWKGFRAFKTMFEQQ